MRPTHKGWLDELNSALSSSSIDTSAPGAASRCLLVTGPPRSGTTLMLQALRAYLPATVIDHLSASFWLQPDVGVRLSDAMRARTHAENLKPSFSSKWGLTPNWYEPHEFSYFWRDSLSWTSPHSEPTREVVRNTNFSGAAQLLEQAARATALPLAAKGFPLLWCGREFLDVSVSCALIVMTRETDALHKSISSGWKLSDDWFSLRPLGWRALADRPVAERVDYQVGRLVESSEKLLATKHERIFEVSLEALADDPRATVEELHHKLVARSFLAGNRGA